MPKNGLYDGIKFDMDDKRFRIKPHQQIMSSCTGALITSLMSKAKNNFFFLSILFALNYYEIE